MDVLFVTYNRIGDAVLSSGLLSHLMQARPQARFTVACGPAAAGLFAGAPAVETVIALAKRPLAGHWAALWRRVAARRWSLVVDLRATLLAWLLRADKRRVLQPARRPVHRVRHIAGLCGLAEAPPAPRLWPQARHRTSAEALLGAAGTPLLALGPTANWRGKQWPAERFAELALRLAGPGSALAGARFAVLGGPGERPAAVPLLAALPPARTLDLVDGVDLLTAYALLERADLYVGNDSGLMHMAAAAGAPTLGLFGPSREELYAPWGSRAAAVRGGRSFEEIVGDPDYDRHRPQSWMEDLSVDAAEAAAHALLRRLRTTA